MSSRVQIVRTDAGYHGRILGGNGEPVWWTEPYTDDRTAYEALSLLGQVFLGSHGAVAGEGVLTFGLDDDPVGTKLTVPVELVDERGQGLPARQSPVTDPRASGGMLIPRPDRSVGGAP